MARSGKAPTVYGSVPRILPDGGTVLVLGSGPSLTRADVTLAAAHVEAVIAVNDSYRHMPDATCLYAADPKWWGWHDVRKAHRVGAVKYPAFTGRFKYTLTSHAAGYPLPPAEMLRRGPETGLSKDPARVALGRNGVYQSINVAVHFGASRILLLGVDMQGTSHDFGRHPDNSLPPYSDCLKRFATLVDPLAALGIELINCSRQTALKCFPRVPLEEALCINALSRAV